jgi:hypothetical protein
MDVIRDLYPRKPIFPLASTVRYITVNQFDLVRGSEVAIDVGSAGKRRYAAQRLAWY